jgi:hypothetical protein
MTDYGPKITKLTGNEIRVSANDRARAFWLIQKYSSLAYTRRMSVLFFNFVGGYEDFAKTKTAGVRFYRDNLTEFYADQALLTKGLDLLERGYKIGYASILQGSSFEDYLSGMRFEGGRENEEIGWRNGAPAVGLYSWADAAMTMKLRVAPTLKAEFAFPRILTPFFGGPTPTRLPPSPPPHGPSIRTGDEVPTSGIWQPISVPSGCPNYLWAGRYAPPAQRATEMAEYPAFPGGRWNAPTPAHIDYNYGPEPTHWQLLWEDHRYEGGQVPDESGYLDPTTDPPIWPPQVIDPS